MKRVEKEGEKRGGERVGRLIWERSLSHLHEKGRDKEGWAA
jgi:hypothetical protein